MNITRQIGLLVLASLLQVCSGQAAAPALQLQSGGPVAGERLIDAIIMVESQGNPRCVGSAGERGLMQIRRETWRSVTREMFGHPLPFQQAFDPKLNRRVGRAYLARLQEDIAPYRARWHADERSLLIAAYNVGPTSLAQRGFNLRRLPPSARDYVVRVRNLHDVLLGELSAAQQRRATDQAALQTAGPLRIATL
jgi:hypothetical protein